MRNTWIRGTAWAVMRLSALLLASCGGGSGGGAGGSVTLAVVTSSLPTGQVGQSYSAALQATGGSGALTWSVTSGTLPAGLALGASTGKISGTPSVAAQQTPLTFTVRDAASHSGSASLPLTVSPLSVGPTTVSPVRAGVTITQSLSLMATTGDSAGVNWTVTPAGPALTPTASKSGESISFTAAAAGVYTVTAASVTDPAQRSTVTVGVTDLAGMYTYHNDLARDGVNTREFALTSANVSGSSFGKLFACTVDGAIYPQPLWVANLVVGGATHNIVLVATGHDSLYAFDADTSPCLQLWHVSLVDTAHGGGGAETSVPYTSTNYFFGAGKPVMSPEVGVTGTPVIDPATRTLYVVSLSMNLSTTTFYQRLHAIDITTGTERAGSPITIAGNATTAASGTVTFDPRQQHQRPGLALVNGTVYVTWASHEDADPWYGWIMAFSYAGALTQSAVLNVAPNESRSGIWMAGGAPVADSTGNLYVMTGNGVFDADTSTTPPFDYGDAVLKINPGLQITSWFSPSDQLADYTGDVDLGSGAAILLNPTGGTPYILGAGKDKKIYLLNSAALGGSGDTQAVQTLSLGSGVFSTAAFWNNTLYINPVNAPLQAYSFDTANGIFNAATTSQAPEAVGWPGASPSISSAASSGDGVVWIVDSASNCQLTSPCGPAVLRAYSASNLGNELWNSSASSADTAGNAIRFVVPTVANGKVYVGTRGNNTGGVVGSTTIPGELDVYGLRPN